MGTRGAIGFRFREADKLTYNHFDSYPSHLGVVMLDTVRSFNDEQIAGAANRVELVAYDSVPTPEQQVRYAAHANENVTGNGQGLNDWYVLLRNAQGTLAPYIDGTIDHMIDNNEFVYESLFCEWAYILNADTRKIEFYKGFNETPGGAGRYAHKLEDPPTDRDGIVYRAAKYYGVRLMLELPFAVVRMPKFSPKRFCTLFEAWASVTTGDIEPSDDSEWAKTAKGNAAKFEKYLARFLPERTLPEQAREALGWSAEEVNV